MQGNNGTDHRTDQYPFRSLLAVWRQRLFKRPDMVLICDPKFVTYISLNWDASGFPPNEWFALAATAGNAVTAVDLEKLEAAARRCHRAALKDESELARIELREAAIECQAFTRDGGGVVVDVAIPLRKN
ncbi:hypothetical protein ACTGJ9_020875 [Bradyrhizobium sp. RDM12]